MPTLAAHRPGNSFPLGATLVPGGANFSVFSKLSTGAQLLLFDDVDASTPSRVIISTRGPIVPYHYWHVFVPGVTADQIHIPIRLKQVAQLLREDAECGRRRSAWRWP